MFVRKYNISMFYIIALFVVYIAGMNIYINHLGSSFASEHEAASYEITYRTNDFTDEELVADDGTLFLPIPSRFMFYNEEGENLVLSNNLSSEYHELNKSVFNLENNYIILGALLFVFTAFGLLLCSKNRYNVSGYIILIMFSFSVSIRLGVLNNFTVILVIVGTIGALLVYNSRFVDWNENIFLTFGKNKEKRNNMIFCNNKDR